MSSNDRTHKNRSRLMGGLPPILDQNQKHEIYNPLHRMSSAKVVAHILCTSRAANALAFTGASCMGTLALEHRYCKCNSDLGML